MGMNPALTLMAAGSAVAFTPTSISGLGIWYDASDTATITSSGGLVSQWNDKSGNGQNLVQATDAKKPTTAGTTQNGLNVLQFDGDRIMDRTPSPVLAASGFTVFIVFIRTGADPTYVNSALLLEKTDSSAVPFVRWHQSGTNSFYFGAAPDQNAAWLDMRNGCDSWGVQTCSATKDAGGAGIHTASEWYNGTLSRTASKTTTWATTSQVITVGSRHDAVTKFIGNVGEILCYNSELGTSDRESVEAYLQVKWATP